MRLQTVLLPENRFCQEEELYYHRHGNRIDFDGYFNLFQVEKRKKYTTLREIRLVLRAAGYCEVILWRDRNELGRESICRDGGIAYEFSFPYDQTETGVFWFSLVEGEWEGERVVDAAFEGTPETVREVRLAVDICTYRREECILRNMEALYGLIKGEAERTEVSQHLYVYLVDNGQTLDKNTEIMRLVSESDGRIKVFPNRNSGGAGGFTRGMLEVLGEKEKLGLTHILLMDDDVVFDTELFVRLYGFLTVLREDCRDLRVGGILMREDFPYLQQSAGEEYEQFVFKNEYPFVDLRSFEACMASFSIGRGKEKALYSGWWCCCYSLEVVRRDNLPLPIFLHRDDIEYELRNQEAGIVFLNGIGVWHKCFGAIFPGAVWYYDMRNTLIITALQGPRLSKHRIKKWVWKCITALVMEFRYEEAELVCQAVHDFCRGPGWLLKNDPEKLNRRIRESVHFSIEEEIKQQLTKEEYKLAKSLVNEYQERFGEKLCEYYSSAGGKGLMARIEKAALPLGLFGAQRGLAVLSPLDSPLKALFKKKLLLFEPLSGKTMLVSKKDRTLRDIVQLYVKTGFMVDKGYEKAVQKYKNRQRELTGEAVWIRYLGLDNRGGDQKQG